MGDEKCCFSKYQLNYFRVCHLATNVLPGSLGVLFVNQWNLKFGSQYGPWRNEAKNGQDFLSLESPANRKRNRELLNVMVNGNISQWDCTKLFYAILFSTSVGSTIPPQTRKHLNDLREFRNESFAHVKKGEVSSSDFQKIVNKVLQAFLGLGLTTSEIKTIQNQNSFSTEEILELQEKLEQEKNSQEHLDLRISNLESRVATLENPTEEDLLITNSLSYSGKLSSESCNFGKPINTPFTILPRRPCHQVIYNRNVDKARNVLDDLKRMHSDKVTAINILGAPGSGKTECARQLGKALSAEISFIMTLDATSLEHFSISLRNFAERLGFVEEGMQFMQRASSISQIEVLSLFIEEKISSLSSWLLILDGLSENTRDVLRYLPQPSDCGTGQIIITSQDKSVVVDNPCSATIYLENCLSEDEALQLLSAIAGPLDPGTAAIVSQKLGNQPIFLVAAATRVSRLSMKTGRTINNTWKQFLENLKKYKEEEQPYYLAALTQTTRANLDSILERMMERCQISRELFHLLVLAQGAALPLDFVTQFLSFELNVSAADVANSLRNCSIVVSSAKDGSNLVEVNGVIYKLLSDLFAPTVRTERMVCRLKCICHFVVKTAHDLTSCKVFKLFTPKILQYLSLLDLCFPDNAEQRSLHHELGKAFLCVLVDYSAAVRCFTKAMSFFESANDITHVEYARLLSSLGNVFRLTGSLDDSCKYLNQSLKLLRSLNNGLLNEDVASCLSNLGLVYQSQGDLDRARKLHHRALLIREEIHGDRDIKTATSLHNIGGVYHQRGDLEAAKDYYWKALDIKGRHYGWDVPHVANSFNNIAEISHEQGDLCGAVSIHKRALEIRRRLYGEEHPDIANSLNNIGVIYHKQRELSSARKYHARALEIRKKVFGREHKEVASSLSNLGEVYYDEGDLAAAERCHTQALDIRQRHSVTSFDAHVITSLHNLIRVYVADKEMTTATAYAYDVFKICQQIYGMRDPRTVNAFRRLTELSKKESQDQTFDTDFNIYEHVERLSCL